MDAILNIIKPSGMTSHDVVSFVRKLLPGMKVGHTGTLDPAAAGVLPLCVGKATRLSSFLLEGSKGYRAEATLGIETDTLDSQGKVLSRQSVKGVSSGDVKKVLSGYTGETDQVPPAHSAIRYRGRKSYEWAHRGKSVKLPSRRVKIFNVELVEFIDDTFPRIIFDVECSHGTYIRSLALQIGKDLGSGAYLSFLLRTRSGPFTLYNAITLEDVQMAARDNNTEREAFPMDYAIKHLKRVTVINEALRYLAQGNYLFKEQVKCKTGFTEKKELFRVYDMQDRFWGIGEWQMASGELVFKPVKLLRSFREDS